MSYLVDSQRRLSSAQLHEVFEVCVSALREMDVLKDIGVEKPKHIAAELIDGWSLADIAPYSRTLQ